MNLVKNPLVAALPFVLSAAGEPLGRRVPCIESLSRVSRHLVAGCIEGDRSDSVAAEEEMGTFSAAPLRADEKTAYLGDIRTWETAMILSRTLACLVLCSLCFGCQSASERPLTPEERSAIADSVGQQFSEIAEATNALDIDRLLGQYRRSEDLTYVARGRVTRSYESFGELVHAQFGGIAEADLRWLKTHVDVLSREVAVVTATYEFTVTVGNGASAQSAGTFICIYVLGDGRWQIQYSAHSFRPARG